MSSRLSLQHSSSEVVLTLSISFGVTLSGQRAEAAARDVGSALEPGGECAQREG
jgi:hypothetical protein